MERVPWCPMKASQKGSHVLTIDQVGLVVQVAVGSSAGTAYTPVPRQQHLFHIRASSLIFSRVFCESR